MRALTFTLGALLAGASAAMAEIIASQPARPMQAEAVVLMLLCSIVGLSLCGTAASARRF